MGGSWKRKAMLMKKMLEADRIDEAWIVRVSTRLMGNWLGTLG